MNTLLTFFRPLSSCGPENVFHSKQLDGKRLCRPPEKRESAVNGAHPFAHREARANWRSRLGPRGGEAGEEVAPGLAAVAESVFRGGVQLAEGAVAALRHEDRVPPQARAAPGGEGQRPRA